MPYEWSKTNSDTSAKLTLWPHQSLPPKGFAAFILATFTLSTIPLYALLGTVLLWGLLPFLLLALGGTYFALRKNDRDRQIVEILTVDPETIHLLRQSRSGEDQEWECNPYWTRITMHDKSGPVPHYVTLKGNGREVEIGAFLSEEERKTLYSDLNDCIRKLAQP